MAVSTAWQISRGPERLLPQVCEMCFVIHYQEQKKKKRRENVKFTIHVLSRLTALLTWAASLGWTSAVTCCNIYREYYEPVVFTLSYVHRSCSSHHFILFEYLTIACMHILPLPPCGLYSIRAQNGYGQHRSCKIVLLTLVAPRGVTDLYLSWGINIEHARAAYHETCGIEYQQPHRRCNSQPPYYKWNIAQARPMSVSYVSRSLQSWVSTTHRSYSQLTFFNIYIKNIIRQTTASRVCLRTYIVFVLRRDICIIIIVQGLRGCVIQRLQRPLKRRTAHLIITFTFQLNS